ncbi:hypothetical protein [Arthrobacter sp. UM1]|uniref:hypothetical protein n=1 Tax=Arthrobacter sp. UM1 TaxID=2766776 RepID=UPI001CF6D4E8|nr:hypothetical protein [Arthrobacter sp. UM1]MCB4207835.1 hypothetical protein [Arthrobacter sp. UM1]
MPARRSRLLTAALFIWAAGWLVGTVRAVGCLAGRQLHADPNTADAFSLCARCLEVALTAATLVALTVLTVKTASDQPISRLGFFLPRTAPQVRRTVVSAALYWVVISLGFFAATSFNVMVNTPVPPQHAARLGDPATSVLDAVSSVIAGPMEEAFLPSALVFFLVESRVARPLIWVVVIAARVSFHLYYGYSFAVGIAVWAVFAILFWNATRNVLAMAVMHSAFNLVSVPNLHFHNLIPALSLAGIAILVLLVFHREALQQMDRISSAANLRLEPPSFLRKPVRRSGVRVA